MVQVGNETKNGLLYGSGTQSIPGRNLAAVSGRKRPVDASAPCNCCTPVCKACVWARAQAKVPLTILHLPDGQDTDFVKNYLAELDKSAASQQNIDLNFDIIGLSYYPAKPWDKKAGYPRWEMPKLQASMNYHRALIYTSR